MPKYSVNTTTAIPVSSAANDLCIQIDKGVLWGLWVYAVYKERKKLLRQIRISNVSTISFISQEYTYNAPLP